MTDVQIKGGKYGAEIKINHCWYSLLPKVKWYEFLLPFNMLYLGHYIGPKKAALRKSKYNQFSLISLGWGLGGILSAFLVRYAIDLIGFEQGIFNTSLFFSGSIGVIIWFILRKKLWLNQMPEKEFPKLYLTPGIKTLALNIFITVFMLAISIFMITVSFASVRITDWRFLIVMPMFGAFFMYTGLFANIPLRNSQYHIRQISYQGRKITTTELEDIMKELNEH